MTKTRSWWLFGIVGIALWLPAVEARDWPQFRGPGGQGISEAGGVPTQWSEKENIIWKKALPGTGWSSPVLVGGKIYLTAAVDESGGKRGLHVLCLDSGAGEIVWNQRVLGAEADSPNIHRKNSHASPTPVIEDGRVYAHFGHQGTVCLDLNGKVIWRQTELSYEPVHGGGGSPVIAGEHLIFTCDGETDPFVAAISKRTGKLVWKFERDTDAKKKFSFATPLVIEVRGKQQVVAPGSGGVSSLDPQNGKEIWFVDYGQGYSVIPRPVYGHGMVFLSSGYNKAVAMAIRVDGKGDITESHVVWETDSRAPNTPSMILVGEELYMTSDGGVTTCLEAKSGDEYWSERTGGDTSASPVFANGRIYFQDEKGTTTVVAAGTEFEMLATNTIDGRTLSSMAIDDGVIYLRSETHLYKIGAGTKP